VRASLRPALVALVLALAPGCPGDDDDSGAAPDDDDAAVDDDDTIDDDDDDTTPCPDADGDGGCDDVDPCFGDDSTGDGDGDGICDDLDLCTGTEACGAVWAIASHEGHIKLLDLDTGQELAGSQLQAGDELDSWGAHGLAEDPTSGTLWIVLALPLGMERFLGTVEPETGEVTVVGEPGHHLSAIAFDPAGRLLAVSGSGNEPPETLFELDTTTAAATELMPLGAGGGGEALALHPPSGLLLHMSGGEDQVAEVLDPDALTLTDVPLSGFGSQEVNGLTWSPILGVYLACGFDDRLWTVTPEGARARTGIPVAYPCNGLSVY
jgi:hypothetical protein